MTLANKINAEVKDSVLVQFYCYSQGVEWEHPSTTPSPTPSSFSFDSCYFTPNIWDASRTPSPPSVRLNSQSPLLLQWNYCSCECCSRLTNEPILQYHFPEQHPNHDLSDIILAEAKGHVLEFVQTQVCMR